MEIPVIFLLISVNSGGNRRGKKRWEYHEFEILQIPVESEEEKNSWNITNSWILWKFRRPKNGIPVICAAVSDFLGQEGNKTRLEYHCFVGEP